MEPQPLPPADPPPSLTQRLGSALIERDPGAATGDGRRIGLMLALLLPMGPALTLVGAQWMTTWRHASIAAAEGEPAARRAAAALAERRILRELAARDLSSILEAVARALPDGDRLVTLALEDGDDGAARLTASVATADPDRLRAAMARDPMTSTLRSTGERRGDGVLIVSLEADR